MNTIVCCFFKRPYISCLLFLLFATPDSYYAQDVSIQDFRIPETKYQRLVGSLSGILDKTIYNSAEYSFGTLQNENLNSSKHSNINSALYYAFADFNEYQSLEIGAQMRGELTYQKTNADYFSLSSPYKSDQLQKNYRVSISPDIRYSKYIVPDDWFWYAEGSGNYTFNQSTENYNVTYTSGFFYNDSSFTKLNYWTATAGGGIGYGKFRDGSAIFAVVRILEELEDDSVFVRPLEKHEILRLVEVYARRIEYAYSQDEYEKFFLEDIFSILQEIGVIKENCVSAYSVLKALQVLSEQIEPRLFGWRARIGLQRRFTEEIITRDISGINPYSSEYRWHTGDYAVLSFEYGYPFTLNLHLNSSLSIEIPRVDYERKIGYRYRISGIYQVGERIDATISGSAERSSTPYQNADENEFIRDLRYSAGISFRFFIENNVNLNVNFSYSEQRQDRFSVSAPGSSDSQFPAIEFGISYRFL